MEIQAPPNVLIFRMNHTFPSHLGCWLTSATGSLGCGDLNIIKNGWVQTVTFGFNLVGLCLDFSFPLASSHNLAWILNLGFPAILQIPSDLGYGISLLDSSAWSSVSLFPQLPPALFSFPFLRRAQWPAPSACLSCLILFKKAFPSPTATPVIPGLREGFLWNRAAEGLLSPCCWPFLGTCPFHSTSESPCGTVEQLTHLLFWSCLFSREKWQPGELAGKHVTLCCIILCWGPGKRMREEHIQHLLAGPEEPRLSLSFCFKAWLSAGDESNSPDIREDWIALSLSGMRGGRWTCYFVTTSTCDLFLAHFSTSPAAWGCIPKFKSRLSHLLYNLGLSPHSSLICCRFCSEPYLSTAIVVIVLSSELLRTKWNTAC